MVAARQRPQVIALIAPIAALFADMKNINTYGSLTEKYLPTTTVWGAQCVTHAVRKTIVMGTPEHVLFAALLLPMSISGLGTADNMVNILMFWVVTAERQ